MLFAWIYAQPVSQPPVYRSASIPSGIAPLVLLSERANLPPVKVEPEEQSEPEPAELQPDKDAPPEVATDISLSERTCHTIGPLAQVDEVTRIAQNLNAQGFVTRRRSSTVRQPSGYWVYLPAMPAAEARHIVSELSANGMKDYFIGKQNYISLGIFRSKEQAQVRLEQVTAFGYEPVLEQRYRNRTEYWLDVEAAAQSLQASPIWRQVKVRLPDIRVEDIKCE